jgi:hypothetical protein
LWTGNTAKEFSKNGGCFDPCSKQTNSWVEATLNCSHPGSTAGMMIVIIIIIIIIIVIIIITIITAASAEIEEKEEVYKCLYFSPQGQGTTIRCN